MKIARPRRHKARIEMIPLLDVIFLLLVTFILFSMTMTAQKGISLELPGAGTASVEKGAPVTVSIDADGTIFLEGHRVEPSTLSRQVTLLLRGDPDQRVMVSGDRNVSYDRIIFVMDAIRSAGVTGVVLETTGKAGEGEAGERTFKPPGESSER
ncbi:MAG: biopolymer transporter ExbD [Syntrophales bacterium]|jgi:biopolymer transport protein ExbD|nr:biopolymer transporter ExbD [Syntrophales bacterium]MCK9527477.1 biopolymer transporter ExbD [Syntrophales bacterium]MDX9922533.1 biopolymer transporter ExbD [Syntrophales bacterium]